MFSAKLNKYSKPNFIKGERFFPWMPVFTRDFAEIHPFRQLTVAQIFHSFRQLSDHIWSPYVREDFSSVARKCLISVNVLFCCCQLHCNSPHYVIRTGRYSISLISLSGIFEKSCLLIFFETMKSSYPRSSKVQHDLSSSNVELSAALKILENFLFVIKNLLSV